MPVESKRNAWIAFRRSTPSARVRLFCLPYAGAGASVFRSWVDFLPREVELCAIQLPGREDRLRDALFTRLDPLVEELAGHLAHDLDMPFAVFGHSMGSIVAYELACFLRRAGLPMPAYLFVSGRRAPQTPRHHETFHDLPDARFIEKLRELNGTPEAVLQHQELLAFVLPTLKADFAVCETYTYKAEPALECPISAFGGLTDDEVSKDDLEAWGSLTRGSFRVEFFRGNHFFLHDSRASLLAAVTADLRKTLSAVPAPSRLANGA